MKFITFPSKNIPLPSTCCPYQWAAIHFPRCSSLKTFELSLTHLCLILGIYCYQLQLFALEHLLIYSFLCIHCFLLIFIARFHSHIIWGCLSGPTLFIHYIYCGSSLPKPQLSLFSVSSTLHPQA